MVGLHGLRQTQPNKKLVYIYCLSTEVNRQIENVIVDVNVIILLVALSYNFSLSHGYRTR